MSTRCSLRITAEWPPPPTAGSYTISFNRGDGYAPRSTPILRCARDLFHALFSAMLRDGFVLRVDVARAAQRQAPWPRWCLDHSQLEALFASIVDKADDDLAVLYPLSIWVLRPGDAKAEQAIDLHRALPNDMSIWEHIFEADVGRADVVAQFVDLVIPTPRAALALEWVQTAVLNADETVECELEMGP